MTEVLGFSGVARSTWYTQTTPLASPSLSFTARPRGRPVPGYTKNRDGSIVLDSAITQWITGYRSRIEFRNAGGVDKLQHYLRRDHGVYINRKKIYRICLENGLLLEKRSGVPRSKRRISRNHVVNAPNHLWEFDIKYGYVHGESRFFFILAFVDVFTRKCVGLHVGLSCRQGDLCFVLTQALENEQLRADQDLIIRSDNGPQMRSNEFHKYLEKLELKLEHEFIPVQTPNKNAHVESFFSIVESEFIQVRYFHTFADAYDQTHQWVKHYNSYRIHGSLGMRTPVEVVELWKTGETLGIVAVRL